METMRVSGIRKVRGPVYNELSALVDEQRVYLRVPARFALHDSYTFFLAVCLLEAMVDKKSITLEEPACLPEPLLNRIGMLQAVYASWNRNLAVIPIGARSCQKEPEHHFIGAYYSGGVDSNYTVVTHREELTHLIILNCFDYDNSDESWSARIEAFAGFASSVGKTLIPVETNARVWLRERQISWEFAHGLILASLGGVLGMKRLYIPSSHTYDELFPWGSHPLTDPMWSTASTEIIHDRAAPRTEKTREVVAAGMGDDLRVCWKDTSTNCGECAKCVRTMTAVYLLGQKLRSLPELTDLRLLDALYPTDVNSASQLKELVQLAAEVGNKPVERRLARLMRSYQLRNLAADMDRIVLGSRLRAVYRSVAKPQWLSKRVTLTGDHKS